jgi:hypothetical protein
MAYSSRTGRRVSNGAAGRQSWAEGEVVNVGFVRGLEVVKRVPTLGDHAPDAYALWQPATGRKRLWRDGRREMTMAELERALAVLRWGWPDLAEELGLHRGAPRRWRHVPPAVAAWIEQMVAFRVRNPAPRDWREAA